MANIIQMAKFDSLNEVKKELVLSQISEARLLGLTLLEAQGISSNQHEFSDAIHLALCVAAERFEMSTNIKFLTFALNFIKGTLMASVACNSIVSIQEEADQEMTLFAAEGEKFENTPATLFQTVIYAGISLPESKIQA